MTGSRWNRKAGLAFVAVVFWLAVLAGAAWAKGCIQGDCVNGVGTFVYQDGEKYTGAWKNGKRHGQGTCTKPDGRQYVGEWKEDLPNGQGTTTFPDGGKYVGEYQNGRFHGQGTRTMPDGRKYVGEWRDSKRLGLGILTHPSGELQRGIWEGGNLVQPLSKQEYDARLKAAGGAAKARKAAALEAERQRLAEDKARIESQKAEQKRTAEELKRLAEERKRLEAEQKQLASAEADRQRLAEEQARLERQKADLAERRRKVEEARARPQADGPEPRRVALVIGNGAYKEAPLKNPVNDARDIASTLKGLGFEVILRQNADLKVMEQAVDEFYDSLKKGGVGLFYFAGHGLQVQGVNYLIPVNARLKSESDVRFQAVDAGRVLGKMEDAGNGLNLVILDACRNNPFARSFRTASQGLAKMDAPTGSLVAYSTAPGSVAADGAGKNGVYTKHLLQNLTTPGLSVHEMFMRVRLGVVEETKKAQVPWEASSLTGYFYFAGQQ